VDGVEDGMTPASASPAAPDGLLVSSIGPPKGCC
jgi:hypothetical protein